MIIVYKIGNHSGKILKLLGCCSVNKWELLVDNDIFKSHSCNHRETVASAGFHTHAYIYVSDHPQGSLNHTVCTWPTDLQSMSPKGNYNDVFLIKMNTVSFLANCFYWVSRLKTLKDVTKLPSMAFTAPMVTFLLHSFLLWNLLHISFVLLQSVFDFRLEFRILIYQTS